MAERLVTANLGMLLTRLVSDLDNIETAEFQVIERIVAQAVGAVHKERRRRILAKYDGCQSSYLAVMKLEKFAKPHGGLKRNDLWGMLKTMTIGDIIHVDWIDSNIRSGISICETLLDMGFSTKATKDGYLIMRIS